MWISGKLSKKPGHSQPELSFLLFNPKANIDKENICYFNNKYFSQPTCNKSSLSKKGWRPPVKALDGSDALKLNFLTKENFYELDKMPTKDLLSSPKDTNCKINVQSEEYDKNISVDLPSTVEGFISSLFQQPVDKSQTAPIDLSNFNPSIPDNKENNYSFRQKTSIAEISLASESLSSICDLRLANNAHEDIELLKGELISISEKVNPNSVDNKPAPATVLNEENSDESLLNKTLSNMCKTNGDTKYMNNSINEPLNEPISEEASANLQTENYNVENNNKEIINSKREEIMNFTEMLTQENTKLRDRNTLEVHKNPECDDKNTILGYNKDEDIGSNNTKTELKDNGSMCDLNAHEDIINSIDMILSEGQNTPSNICQEEKDIYNNNEEDKNSQRLVDSVFENSSSNDECEFYDSNNSNIMGNKRSNNTKQCATESIANDQLYENSTEMKPENIEIGFSNIGQEKGNSQKEEATDSLSLPGKTREGNSKNNCMKSRTTNNEPVLCYNENIENIQGEEIVVVDEGDKNVSNVADEEEYSCLMISNSQLLEIEKSYYETPIKKNSTRATFNDKNCKVYNETLSNKTLVSVSTQTEVVFEYASTEQCVPLKTPHLEWPSKMIETQRRLREAVQEIQRLK